MLGKSSVNNAGIPNVQVPTLHSWWEDVSKNEGTWGVCDGTVLGTWRKYCLVKQLAGEEGFFFKTVVLNLGT